jgi:hypothetical protein
MAFCRVCDFLDESLPDLENFECFLCEQDKMRTNVQYQAQNANKGSDTFFDRLQDGLEILDPDHERDNEYDGYRDDDDL